MKESRFIKENKENWLEFENNLRYKKNKASRLNRLFVQITDDLSYARSFYKSRSVKVYLNGIAQVLFNELYRNKSGNFKNFISFWKRDLPRQIHESRNEFKIAFLIFMLAFTIGIISSIYDKSFAQLILGKDYVEMTLENIKKNDPMAVYRKAHETTMFASIAVNNLVVATTTFVMGIFFGIGTILILIRNAIMVGGFQYFFIEKGIFLDSFLTIWQHGTLEISSIIIAGAAGITLGKGLIFSGTYSRLDAFKISAMRGLKIFAGITPVIILAGFIEGFITRHTEVNNYIRLSVILVSLIFVLTYFVWYPWHLSKKGIFTAVKSDALKKAEENGIVIDKIQSAEEILGNVISFVKKNILSLLSIIAVISIVHATASLIYEARLGSYYTNTNVGLHTYASFFDIIGKYFQYILGIVALVVLQIILNIKIARHIKKQVQHSISFYLGYIFNLFLISFIILLPFVFGMVWGLLSILILSPYLFLVSFFNFIEKKPLFIAFAQMYELLDFSWGKLFWNSIKIATFVSIVYFMMNTQVVWSVVQAIYINFNYSREIMYLIDIFVMTFIGISLFGLCFTLQVSASAFAFFSIQETRYAANLKKRIAMIGERNNMFGFEKE